MTWSLLSVRGVCVTRVSYADWSRAYDAIRRHAGYQFPAYMIHEAVLWSPVNRVWVFLPRRMSKEPYEETADELRGANTIFTVSEDYTAVTSVVAGVCFVAC